MRISAQRSRGEVTMSTPKGFENKKGAAMQGDEDRREERHTVIHEASK